MRGGWEGGPKNSVGGEEKNKLLSFLRDLRVMDNGNFEREQKNFFKNVERGTEHVGQIPEMEKFVKFWGDI